MLHASSPRLPRRAVALLCVALLAPAAGWSAETEDLDTASASTEQHWYDRLEGPTNQGIDLLVLRPLSLVTLIAGGLLFLPAALMTAPNGMDSVADAYERFVNEPGEYFWGRPLGEF
jgi:predicted cobalt transporter CbtA